MTDVTESTNAVSLTGDQTSVTIEPILQLAKKCEISQLDLENVISINENNVDIVCIIEGSELEQMIIGSLILLLAYEIALKQEWVPSSILLENLKKIGVQDRGRNFSTYMKNRSDLFLINSAKKEYRLTTNKGRKIAAKIIQKLSKREKIAKDDLTDTQSQS